MFSEDAQFHRGEVARAFMMQSPREAGDEPKRSKDEQERIRREKDRIFKKAVNANVEAVTKNDRIFLLGAVTEMIKFWEENPKEVDENWVRVLHQVLILERGGPMNAYQVLAGLERKGTQPAIRVAFLKLLIELAVVYDPFKVPEFEKELAAIGGGTQ